MDYLKDTENEGRFLKVLGLVSGTYRCRLVAHSFNPVTEYKRIEIALSDVGTRYEEADYCDLAHIPSLGDIFDVIFSVRDRKEKILIAIEDLNQDLLRIEDILSLAQGLSTPSDPSKSIASDILNKAIPTLEQASSRFSDVPVHQYKDKPVSRYKAPLAQVVREIVEGYQSEGRETFQAKEIREEASKLGIKRNINAAIYKELRSARDAGTLETLDKGEYYFTGEPVFGFQTENKKEVSMNISQEIRDILQEMRLVHVEFGTKDIIKILNKIVPDRDFSANVSLIIKEEIEAGNVERLGRGAYRFLNFEA